MVDEEKKGGGRDEKKDDETFNYRSKFLRMLNDYFFQTSQCL